MDLKIIECEREMAKNDAIMEPTILDTLRRYVAAGGKPEEAIAFISDNYRGYAQMGTLVTGWLDLLQDPEPGERGRGEAHFLAELVKEKFVPSQADTIFNGGAESVPAWMNNMLQDRTGRNLLYELAEQHRNCLLVSCAIRSIWKAGYEAEVASRSVAAAYFGVLLQLLSHRLQAFLATAERWDPMKTSEITAQLRSTTTSSQEAYLFTQLLLSGLEREPGGDAFRRLMQELEQGAREHAKAPAAVRKMNGLWAESAAEAEAVGAVADVTAPPALQHNDLARLHALFQTEAPPRVALLRDPVLIEKLLAALFAGGNRAGGHGAGGASALRPNTKELVLDVLAYACAAEVSGPHALMDESVMATRAALKEAVAFTEAPPGERFSDLDGPQMQTIITTPVAASGMVRWLGIKLADPEHYTSAYSSTATPMYLKLLEVIGGAQPLLVPQVLEGVRGALECLEKKRADVQQQLVSITAFMLRRGHVEAVMGFAERWALGRAKPDPSLVRFFLTRVLRIAAPPYSRYFAVTVLRLLKLGGEPTEARVYYAEFVEGCLDAGFDPPLAREELSLLQQLRASLGASSQY